MTFSESVIFHEKSFAGIVLRTGVDSSVFTVPLDAASAVASGGILSKFVYNVVSDTPWNTAKFLDICVFEES